MPTTTTTITSASACGKTTTVTTTEAIPEPAPPAPPAPAGAAPQHASGVTKPPGPDELNDWIALSSERPLEPINELPILDCHHHFFDVAKKYHGDDIVDTPLPFLQGMINGFILSPSFESTFGVRNAIMAPIHMHDMAQLQAGHGKFYTYKEPELLADMAGNNVVGTLFEECGYMEDIAGYADPLDGGELFAPVGEVRAVQKVKDAYSGKQNQLCLGMNASAALSAGAEAIEPVLAEMAKYSVMRGIRESCSAVDFECPELFNFGAHKPGGMWMYDEALFRSGYALLEKYNLSFDAWIYYKQIPAVVRLAKDFPNIPICLCHEGSPTFMQKKTAAKVPSYEEVLAEWKGYIDEAAKCPNMVCKSDCLPMAFGPHDWYDRPEPPTSQEVAQRLAPFYMYTVEQFGIDRVMFASNFPMDKTSVPYTVLWNAYKIMTSHLPLSDRKKLFGGNANKFYRLGLDM